MAVISFPIDLLLNREIDSEVIENCVNGSHRITTKIMDFIKIEIPR